MGTCDVAMFSSKVFFSFGNFLVMFVNFFNFSLIAVFSLLIYSFFSLPPKILSINKIGS